MAARLPTFHKKEVISAMEPIFQKEFQVTDICVDRFGRLKPSAMLIYAQELAEGQCKELSLGSEDLARRRLFWAVTRHKVQITQLPCIGQKLRIETWPMPATRVAYPRSMVAYDEQGNECFRSVSLWVIMDLDTRNMILPGKNGISIPGTLRGGELPSPTGCLMLPRGSSQVRTVRYTDLDRNGHMNNTRYLEWIDDLLPSAFHRGRTVKEFTVCYLSEVLEGQSLNLQWDFVDNDTLQVDAHRRSGDKDERVFSARLLFD